jgi:hypothetical protein
MGRTCDEGKYEYEHFLWIYWCDLSTAFSLLTQVLACLIVQRQQSLVQSWAPAQLVKLLYSFTLNIK